MESEEIAGMLRDLLWLNAFIATELVQVTENTSSMLRNAPPPAACLADHEKLRETALQIAEKYRPGTALRSHITGHR